ncbi:EpsG family protein [Helicobacter himalayensis]|uniref:EpsG family protein n=1 Tax=Helicobacter himalayensis TaxID=1591088 RepID=UPI0008360ECD|nr:EpsG family protein [Helicobacter himalayensis]
MSLQSFIHTNNTRTSSFDLHMVFEALCVFIPCLFIPFSASIAFFVGLASLFLLSFFYPSRFARISLALIIMVSGSVTYGDILFLGMGDQGIYYSTYLDMVYKNYDAIFSFNQGVEFIVPLYYAFLSLIFGYIDGVHFLMLSSLSMATLFYIWLEKYELPKFSKKEAALCVCLALLMFSYYQAAHLQRQMYSTIFILFALSQKRRLPMIFFLVFAFCSHVSAIFFFIIYYLLRHHTKVGFILIGVSCFLILSSMLMPFLFQYANVMGDIFASKLGYYVYQNFYTSFASIVTKMPLFVIIVVLCWHYRDKIDKSWVYIILGYGIFMFCANLGYTHFMHRASPIFLYIPLGFFLFLVFRNNTFLLYSSVIVVFFAQIYITYIWQPNFVAERQAMYHYGVGGDWFYFLLN